MGIKKPALRGWLTIDLLCKTICCIAASKVERFRSRVQRKGHEVRYNLYEMQEPFVQTTILP